MSPPQLRRHRRGAAPETGFAKPRAGRPRPRRHGPRTYRCAVRWEPEQGEGAAGSGADGTAGTSDGTAAVRPPAVPLCCAPPCGTGVSAQGLARKASAEGSSLRRWRRRLGLGAPRLARKASGAGRGAGGAGAAAGTAEPTCLRVLRLLGIFGCAADAYMPICPHARMPTCAAELL